MNRLSDIRGQIAPPSLTVIDNRTGKSYQFPITDNTIKAVDFKSIKNENGEFLRTYDPGYMNTVSCTSKISYIDGDKGILNYRGYPIEELAEQSTFMEVTFLLLYGELPTYTQLEIFQKNVINKSNVPQKIKDMIHTFQNDAHPMGILTSAISALGTFHANTNPAMAGQSIYKSKQIQNQEIYTLLGSILSISANILRHGEGLDWCEPKPDFTFSENFLYMVDKNVNSRARPDPNIVKALDVLFILHAEHELNCSTSAARHLSSSNVDIYTSMSAAIGALYGPRHGGANEAVINMLETIQKKQNIPKFIEDVKNRKALLMGFGHRVYKSYDPRAKIVRNLTQQIFQIIGKEQLIDIAIELERIALNDEYFIKRNLYPNVDFYSGLIYKALGFPSKFFTVFFAVARMSGWLSHWLEFQTDPENRIVRPFQVYKGYSKRPYISMNKRSTAVKNEMFMTKPTQIDKRRFNSFN